MTDDNVVPPEEDGPPPPADSSQPNMAMFFQHSIAETMKEQYWNKQNDPSKFPRSSEITDEQSLMLIAERSIKTDVIVELRDKLELLYAEMEVLRKKIFSRLHSLHPDVCGRGENEKPCGFRKFQDRWYLVSWD